MNPCCPNSNLNNYGLLDEHLTACGIIPSHPFKSQIHVVPVQLVIAICILSAITVSMAVNTSMTTIDIMISATSLARVSSLLCGHQCRMDLMDIIGF